MVTDDTSMARLRAVNLVSGSDAVDIYMDGDIVLLGSPRRELTNVPVAWMTGFQYLKPGSHTVTVVPTGKSVDEAMISEDVTLKAGHRYTVAVMGQLEDDNHDALVIDETAAVEEVRTSPEQNIMISVNNLAGLKTHSFDEDGMGPKDVPYGNFKAAPIKAGKVERLLVTGTTEDGSEVTRGSDENFSELPGVDFIDAIYGHYPEDTVTGSQFNSDLNALELLKQFTDILGPEDPLSFNTFLDAVETAGLSEMLTSGTHLIFAPTDRAFEALPQEQRESLMAAPEALRDFLHHHIVEGYYPRGSFSGATFGTRDITVTNMQGEDLEITGDISINGIFMSPLPNAVARNGTSIFPIEQVLMPPE
jgi:uncharacterized surface protein with fasciclin (FAS1) repeats